MILTELALTTFTGQRLRSMHRFRSPRAHGT